VLTSEITVAILHILGVVIIRDNSSILHILDVVVISDNSSILRILGVVTIRDNATDISDDNHT
jgi:hypothetical protein